MVVSQAAPGSFNDPYKSNPPCELYPADNLSVIDP